MKTILSFLKQLSENNQREWFLAHKNDYEKSREIFHQWLIKFHKGLSAFDKDMHDLNPKDCMFRIYRDVRFSGDKSPYKTNFGASFNKSGKKVHNAGYYIHLEPGGCFLAGGIYMPDNQLLKKLRDEVYYNFDEFEKIISEKDFVKFFKQPEGSRLTLSPKGFPKDFHGIEYLKLKDYIIVYYFDDDALLDDKFLKKALTICQAMKPFNDFLNKASS